MKGNWQATKIGLQVNLGREATTRAATHVRAIISRSLHVWSLIAVEWPPQFRLGIVLPYSPRID
jgi:hypothetical protein